MDPLVGNVTFFWIKRGQLDPPVGDVTFFGSKEVSWIPLLVTQRFLDQRRSVGPPVGDVTVMDQRRSVFMVFGWFPWFLRWSHGFSWFLVGFHGF